MRRAQSPKPMNQIKISHRYTARILHLHLINSMQTLCSYLDFKFLEAIPNASHWIIHENTIKKPWMLHPLNPLNWACYQTRNRTGDVGLYQNWTDTHIVLCRLADTIKKKTEKSGPTQMKIRTCPFSPLQIWTQMWKREKSAHHFTVGRYYGHSWFRFGIFNSLKISTNLYDV